MTIKSELQNRADCLTMENPLWAIFNCIKSAEISLLPDTAIDMITIEQRLAGRLHEGIPAFAKRDMGLAPAAAFYMQCIKPSLATGKDSHKVSEEEIIEICKQLSSSVGLHTVIYIAMCKCLSTRRTGSTDGQIDLAHLEMLKHFARMTIIAREMGLNFKVTFVDETTEIPEGHLGITQSDVVQNHQIIRAFTQLTGTEDVLTLRSLTESVRTPLNGSFESLYRDQKQEIRLRIWNFVRAIRSGITTQNEREIRDLVETFVFFEMIPQQNLSAFGLDAETVQQLCSTIIQPSNVALLPDNLLDYCIDLTAHMETVLSLRPAAAEKVRDAGAEEQFPEYSGSVAASVTRKTSKMSFLTHPVKYRGKSVLPMHGIAIYQMGDGKAPVYKGCDALANIAPYATIMRLNTKPIAALIQ